jgi:DNA-binding IclR family transcriptional regulator
MQARKEPYNSLNNALKILTSFIPLNREKGTGEISKEIGLHVSSVSRQLKVLARNGFVQLNPRTKLYSLGKTSLELGRAVHQSIRDHFLIIAQPHIDDLRDKLGKDVAMEILIGDSTILFYRAWAPEMHRIRFAMNDRLPVHVAAGARIIMAFSPPSVVDRMLKGELQRLTPRTITDPKLIKKKLEVFKKEGVGYDIGESDANYQFAAAPIFGYGKTPLAAIVIGEPLHKKNMTFTPNEIQQLKDTAKKISFELHYSEENVIE